MKMYCLTLIFLLYLGCEGNGEAESKRLATNLSVQSSVKVPMRLPENIRNKKLRVQIAGLTAEKAPEVIFELSLRCSSRKIEYHLGYINFFNATGKLGREPSFTFDLPDLTQTTCPLRDLYLAIDPQGIVTPDSAPRIRSIDLVAEKNFTSESREQFPR